MKFLTICFLFFFTQFFGYAQNMERTIHIEFEELPLAPVVDLAKLKYNKEFAYSLTLDDGYVDVWNNGFLLLEGQQVVSALMENGVNYGSGTMDLEPGGYNYSDGCGHLEKFKLGISVNARFVDFHTPYLSWSQVQEIYDAGWDVLNHSYNHEVDPTNPVNTFANDPITFEAAIQGNADTIFSKIGFYPRHFVVPSNSQPILCKFGLTDNCTELNTFGMLAIYNQEWTWNGPIIDITEPLDGFPKIRRNTIPKDADAKWSDIIDKIEETANESNAIKKLWINDFTHSIRMDDNLSVPGNSNLGYTYFKNLMDYLHHQYAAKGTDVLWVAGLQEVFEYLHIRNNTSYTTTLIGNTLDVKLKLDSILLDQRDFTVSFLVGANKNIKNIIVDGDGYATYNKATGLVNVALIEEDTTMVSNNKEPSLAFIGSISPNPVSNMLKISFNSRVSTKIKLTFTNVIGQPVQVEHIQAKQGENQIEINVFDLDQGVHYLKMSDGHSTQTVPFVKIK